MNSRTSSISWRVAPCFRAICTCAPNGLPGPAWSWMTTSTAMVIRALVFWSINGSHQASPATRVQKSPNFGWMALSPACRSGSSSTAFFGFSTSWLLLSRPLGADLVEQFLRGEDVAVERQLLALDVTAAPVPAPHPGHAALGDRLARRVVDAVPF